MQHYKSTKKEYNMCACIKDQGGKKGNYGIYKWKDPKYVVL